MKLNTCTIENLTLLINGELKNKVTPYKTGPVLIKIFREVGFKKDEYSWQDGGLPGGISRSVYTKDRLNKINGTDKMQKIILNLLDGRQYYNTEFDVDKIAEEINKIIKYDNYIVEKNGKEYKISGEGVLEKDDIEIEVRFKNIKEMIINKIKAARYSIWISVAWFTDKEILDELIKKKNEDNGMDIQLIISNDETNMYIENKYGIEYSFEKHFKTYRINPFGIFDTNIVHNKFCIIDYETVLNGSYNWTGTAQYNSEDYQITKSIKNAFDYAQRFKELRLGKN